jgi:hypothetical protein
VAHDSVVAGKPSAIAMIVTNLPDFHIFADPKIVERPLR